MIDDRRYSGMQNQASELIEQAFNRGFKAGLEEAKNRSKAEEEEKFRIGDVVSWESPGGYPIKCGIVTGLLTIDEIAGIKVLLSDGTSYLMVTSMPSLKKVSGTNFPCIEECLNFLKNKEDNENSK